MMTETSPSNFYLYLPSNASTHTFPNNGPTGFTVTLPNTLELYGEWEVALASMVYPHSWDTISAPADDKSKIEPNHVGKIMALLSVDRRPANYKDKPGYYNGWVPVYFGCR